MLKTVVHQPPRLVGARLPEERARDIEFAKRLRLLMEKRQLTQSDLAARIWKRYTNSEGKHVARGRDRISVWVNGKNVPSAKNLAKLAKELGVTVEELAPQTLVKVAHHGAADWSFTQPAGEDRVFVQIARFCSPEAAHEIQGILLRDERQRGLRKKE